MKDYEIMEKTIAAYGKNMQLVVAMEEMAELIKELSKNIRGNDNIRAISEEMADVKIMFCQLEMIFDNRDEVLDFTEEKIKRQEERLKKAND